LALPVRNVCRLESRPRGGHGAALANVDLAKGTLRVVRAYSEEAPRGDISPVKDHQSRNVPIPRVMSEELVRDRAQHKPDRLVFPSVNATPHRNRNFRRDVFDSAVDGLGLNITPHIFVTPPQRRPSKRAPRSALWRIRSATNLPQQLSTTMRAFSRPTSTTPPNALARRPVRPSRDSRSIKAIAQRPRYVRMQSAPGKSAPGRIRTCDTGFRRAVLYPLSYEGWGPDGIVDENWAGVGRSDLRS
jgi:hypothetical protein